MAKSAKKPEPAPAPAEGHNLVGFDQATFDKWCAIHSRDTAAVKLAQAQRNKTRKAMRADGIILGIFDRTEKLAEMSSDEQQAEHVHTEAYLKWRRAPRGHQFSLTLVSNDPFEEDDEAVEARIVEGARGAGWRAGLAGKWEDENPYTANTAAGQAWLGAYRDGQKKNAEALSGDNEAPRS